MSGNRETRINVQHSGQHVFRDDFQSMRNHFENEMSRVEQEMNRLRSEFEHSNRYYHGSGAQPIGSSAVAPVAAVKAPPMPHQIQSPLIRDESDGKFVRLRFDVHQYRPEEVTVKTVDNRLIVHAVHKEDAEGKSVFREFNQDFTLPRGTNPENITSSLSVDGILTVEAPIPAPAIEGPRR